MQITLDNAFMCLQLEAQPLVQKPNRLLCLLLSLLLLVIAGLHSSFSELISFCEGPNRTHIKLRDGIYNEADLALPSDVILEGKLSILATYQ